MNFSFDVTMGAYDGAELCELIGLFLLSKIKKIKDLECGLYRDDVLSVSTLPNREKEHKIKKIIIGIFSKDNLKITFYLISTSVNFLNVNSDLKNITFQPYKKPNNDLLYIKSGAIIPQQYLKIFPLEFRTCCVIFQKMRIYLIIIKRYIKRLWITVDMTMNWNLNHQTKEKEQ